MAIEIIYPQVGLRVLHSDTSEITGSNLESWIQEHIFQYVQHNDSDINGLCINCVKRDGDEAYVHYDIIQKGPFIRMVGFIELRPGDVKIYLSNIQRPPYDQPQFQQPFSNRMPNVHPGYFDSRHPGYPPFHGGAGRDFEMNRIRQLNFENGELIRGLSHRIDILQREINALHVMIAESKE